MSDKPTSAYIKAEAEERYAEARKHIIAANTRRDPIRALASQMQFSFGRVLDTLAVMCKVQEDATVERKQILEQLQKIQRRVDDLDVPRTKLHSRYESE
jgi:hypothetical protein